MTTILASKILMQAKKHRELSVILDSNGALALFSEHINSLDNLQNMTAEVLKLFVMQQIRSLAEKRPVLLN